MIKSLIRRGLAAAGYEIRGTRYDLEALKENSRALSFDDLVCRLMFERGCELNFVQVGVCDGVNADPLHRYIESCGWSGVLVEPQPRSVEALRKLYQNNPKISVVAAALGEMEGEQPFYTIESDLEWHRGMASFYRENIAKHVDLIPNIEELIRETTVPVTTFDKVLSRLPKIDLLQIDTEGADAMILALFPFETVKPAIVQWEVKHLSWPEREACLARMASFGYRLAPSSGEDMIATLI